MALLTLALLLGAGAARAQVAFVYSASIYGDEKNRPLKDPEGVACNAAGQLVVADTGNARLVSFSLKGGQVSGGTEMKIEQLPYPARVQIDGKGNLLVLDRKLRKIGRVGANGGFLGFVEAKGVADPGAVAAGAFKLDVADNLYLFDMASLKVLVLDSAGNVVRQLPLPREGAMFTDIAVDAGGTIYAVDAVGATVWSADKAATAFRLLAKSLKDVMTFPIYVDAVRGRLFVVDQNGQGVVVLGLDGSYQGRQLAMGWSEGLVYYPSQLCAIDPGEAAIADRYNGRVQIFTTAR
jgi:DNA-binding beta-propeller fold protein YncE